MNKEEFIQYVEDNFNISGEAFRLISNILDYVSAQGCGEDEQYNMLCMLLDGSIGLSDNEIKQICL